MAGPYRFERIGNLDQGNNGSFFFFFFFFFFVIFAEYEIFLGKNVV